MSRIASRVLISTAIALGASELGVFCPLVPPLDKNDPPRAPGHDGASSPSTAPRSSPHPLSLAFCHGQDPKHATSAADKSAGYLDWLDARGVKGVENVTLCKDGTAHLNSIGQRLFPSRWKRFGWKPNPAVVMAFPLDDAQVLSETSIAADPNYAKHADKGHNIMVMYLMIERMKDAHDRADPWIHYIVERQFSAPITWSFDEIDWLRGTSLYRAVMHRRESLKREWEQGGMQLACSELAKTEGLRSPTFEDFMWASAAFTLLTIPLASAVDGDITHGHGTHSLQIVPGLEIFKPGAGLDGACHLDIDASKHRLCVVCPPQESVNGLTVCHSDENASVEQMLFQFGSLDVDPSNETLMIECPIPPVGEWDASIKRRFALLLEEDLRPQLFLPRRRLRDIVKIAKTFSGKGRANASVRQQQFERMFPEGVRETITIFVMDEDQLRTRISGDIETLGEDAAIAASGMRMAVLTTIVRLLEVKQFELENSDQGTGTLEADQRLLDSINAERSGTTAMPHSGPTTRQLAALRHRMEQKRLVREYLQVYGKALQDEMGYMRRMAG